MRSGTFPPPETYASAVSAPSTRSSCTLGSTRNAVGSSGSLRVRPRRTCASSANPTDAAYPTTTVLALAPASELSGMYTASRARSRAHRTMFPSNRRASLSRAKEELVRKTRTRPRATPARECATDAVASGTTLEAHSARTRVICNPPATPARRSRRAAPAVASTAASPAAMMAGTRAPFHAAQKNAQAVRMRTGSRMRWKTVDVGVDARWRQ